ncbi:MAG: Zn-ribbon domain-containing OB-fold protein [Candidatus Bathyarchaeota archaeon]|nr:Zn-ribbon domain-containing OB-fold protein [Candidatus Bathyarchaeota archaeon]
MSNPTDPFTIEQFYKFLSQGKLMAGKCLTCGKIHLPPRPLCDNCYSQQFQWLPINGKGKLLTYTVIHVAPQQFQSLTPYAVGIVELETGLKIPGMIQGLGQEQLKIGMELTLDFGTCSSPQQWPQWPRYCFKP